MGSRIDTISNLINSILQDPEKFRIPKIQRGFVWDWAKVRDFFESLFKGYPVGIIVIWKTDEYIPSDPVIDPDFVPSQSNRGDERPSYYYYILDGNQRITSLLLSIFNWKIKRGNRIIDLTSEDPTYSNIYYDLENRTFTFSSRSRKVISLTTMLKARILVDWSAMNEIRQYDSNDQKEINIVADKILAHDIPIYEIEKSVKDYEELCEIFNRINFGGVKIKHLDIVLSFFASEFSKFKDRIVEISENYDLDLGVTLRFIFSMFGIKQSQLTRDGALAVTKKIAKEFKDEAIENIISRAELAIKTLWEFLDWLGVRNIRLIPSQISLIPILAWTYYKIEDVKDALHLLKSNERHILKWWIPVIIRQHYTNPDIKLQKDLDLIKKKRNESVFPADELLKNTLRRKKAEKQLTIGEIEILEDYSARKKIFRFIIAILLSKRKAKDFETKEYISELIKRNEFNVHHIFSRNALAKANVDFEEADVQHFANITFLHPKTNSKIRDLPPIEYLSTLSDKELEAHYIPNDEELWKCDKFEEFIKRRRELIINELKRLNILK